jgi:hypothetical protein
MSSGPSGLLIPSIMANEAKLPLHLLLSAGLIQDAEPEGGQRKSQPESAPQNPETLNPLLELADLEGMDGSPRVDFCESPALLGHEFGQADGCSKKEEHSTQEAGGAALVTGQKVGNEKGACGVQQYAGQQLQLPKSADPSIVASGIVATRVGPLTLRMLDQPTQDVSGDLEQKGIEQCKTSEGGGRAICPMEPLGLLMSGNVTQSQEPEDEGLGPVTEGGGDAKEGTPHRAERENCGEGMDAAAMSEQACGAEAQTAVEAADAGCYDLQLSLAQTQEGEGARGSLTGSKQRDMNSEERIGAETSVPDIEKDDAAEGAVLAECGVERGFLRTAIPSELQRDEAGQITGTSGECGGEVKHAYEGELAQAVCPRGTTEPGVNGGLWGLTGSDFRLGLNLRLSHAETLHETAGLPALEEMAVSPGNFQIERGCAPVESRICQTAPHQHSERPLDSPEAPAGGGENGRNPPAGAPPEAVEELQYGPIPPAPLVNEPIDAPSPLAEAGGVEERAIPSPPVEATPERREEHRGGQDPPDKAPPEGGEGQRGGSDLPDEGGEEQASRIRSTRQAVAMAVTSTEFIVIEECLQGEDLSRAKEKDPHRLATLFSLRVRKKRRSLGLDDFRLGGGVRSETEEDGGWDGLVDLETQAGGAGGAEGRVEGGATSEGVRGGGVSEVGGVLGGGGDNVMMGGGLGGRTVREEGGRIALRGEEPCDPTTGKREAIDQGEHVTGLGLEPGVENSELRTDGGDPVQRQEEQAGFVSTRGGMEEEMSPKLPASNGLHKDDGPSRSGQDDLGLDTQLVSPAKL